MSWTTKDSDNPKLAYGGKAVRIKPYWTRALFSDDNQKHPAGNVTTLLLNTAAKILAKYNLGFEWPNRVDVLDFFDHINPGGSADSTAPYKKLRDLIDRTYQSPEDRLIVVFTPLANRSLMGYTVCIGTWLPWVLVDPTRPQYPALLMHEIGHACRLGHFDGTLMQEGYGGTAETDHVLDNFQLNEIYRSYWCAGLRPQNWWERGKANPHQSAFDWPPFAAPTP